MKFKSILLVLFLMGGAFLLNVQAQSGYGYSLLRNYQNEYQNQRMYIESGTILDFDYAYYYTPGLEATVYKNSSILLHHDREILPRGYTGIIRYLDTEAAYGDVFRLHTDHYVGAYRYYNTSQGPRFVDYWGLNYYSGNYPSPYGFLQGPTGYYSYQVYKVATTQVQLTVPRPPLHLDSIDNSGLPPGSNYVTTLRGTGLFGAGQSVQVSGTGVTVRIRPNQQPNTIEVLDIEIDIDENAARGDRQLTLTVGGVTSNAITFRVGDRSPVITGITPAQGNNGNNVTVTISGSAFGFDPQILVDGAGVQANRLSYSADHIEAVMSIATATYIGDRGVTVKSRGLTGNGFQQVPGTSDTSNAVPFRVLDVIVGIPDIPVVEKFGEQTISVTVNGLVGDGRVKFTLEPLQGATGAAQFDNNSNEITKENGNHALKIKGVTESSAVNKMTIRARVVGSDADTIHKEFTVAVINSLIFERINTSDTQLDSNPGNGEPNSNQGQRIYPDKNIPTDGDDHSVVRVKAAIAPDIPNQKIYFASFDLDDPSTDALPIDTTAAAGNDNNCYVLNGVNNCASVGNSKSGQLSNPPGANCTSATVNGNISKIECPISNGGASTNHKVTMQPGDNFAIAASLTNSTVFDNYQNSGLDLRDANNSRVHISGQANSDSSPGIRTEMLTVWRKLHIEKDRMTNVTTNHVSGTVTAGGGKIAVNQNLQIQVSTTLELSRFANGRLVIRSRPFTVIGNNGNIVIAKNISSSSVTVNVNDNFDMYDDDNYDQGGTILNGDEGEAINELPNSLDYLAASDNISQNIYAKAYVVPEYQWAAPYDQANVTFDLNVDSDQTNTDELTSILNVSRGSRNDESASFWVAYFLSGYQGALIEDGDGCRVNPSTGGCQTDPQGFEISEGGNSGISKRLLNTNSSCDCFRAAGQTAACPMSGFLCTQMPTGAFGSVMYQEVQQDVRRSYAAVGYNLTTIPTTAPHELGHQFGLAGDIIRTTFGIMDYSALPTQNAVTLHPEHVNIIRRRVNSPGQ